MTGIIVIHGLQASGKTFHAAKFRAHYRCSRIVDGWIPPRSGIEGHCDDGSWKAPRAGDLVLTTASPAAIAAKLPGAVLVPIATARRAIGVGPIPKTRLTSRTRAFQRRFP